MRKILIPAALAIVLVSAPAAAKSEDSPFEGFYLGVNGGVTWSDSTATAVLTPTSTAPVVNPLITSGNITAINSNTDFNSKHHTGFTGGLEGGYNWVGYHGLLIGLETDFNIYDITGSRNETVTTATTPAVTYTLMHKVDTNWLWTVRPRVGYAGGDFAAFLTGGLAISDLKYNAEFTDSSTPGNNIFIDHNKTKTGWTIGAGAAYAFGAISLKGEYLFQNYGHDHLNTNSANGFYNLEADAHLKSHLFRAGLDYNF